MVDIYLDVDGVLNAVCPDTPQTWGWGESECVTVKGFPIRYSPKMVDRFNALAARDDVQVHWLTTWLRDAPEMLCRKIGLDGCGWPVLGAAEWAAPRKMSDYSWWKLPAARAHFLSNGNRAVWIDDDLTDFAAQEWAAPHVADGTLLLVTPLTHRGLTLAEFDAIEAWIGGAAC